MPGQFLQLGVENAENNVRGYFFEAIVLPYSIGIEDRKHGVDNICLVKQETRKKLEHAILTEINTKYSFEVATCSKTRGDRVDTKGFDDTIVKCICSISILDRCHGEGFKITPQFILIRSK